jgi:Family of unknown function (DUF5681)
VRNSSGGDCGVWRTARAITRWVPGRPPLHARFKEGQSGNPRGRSPKNLATLLADALSEKVYATIDGRRRKITKREAIVTQMVNKSASADLRATKMLIDMLKDIEQKAGVASPPPSPPPFTEPDDVVVEQLVERIRHQVCCRRSQKGKIGDPRK